MGIDIARGDGFVSWTALRYRRELLFSAAFPPFYPTVLAVLHTLGSETIASQRTIVALLGVLDVPLIAYVGRAVGGWRVGAVAAAIAAFSPFLTEVDGSFMNESICITLCLGAMVAVLVGVKRDSARAFRWLAFCSEQRHSRVRKASSSSACSSFHLLHCVQHRDEWLVPCS